MIAKRLSVWLLLASCIVLTACSHNRAQAPEAPVDPVVPLASITLLPIDPPEALFTDNRGVPVFGAVVTGIANTIMDKYKSADFNTQHQAYRQKFGEKLTKALQRELQAQGFTIRLASRSEISRSDQNDMNLRAFANHDAMLDVQVSEVAMCSRRLRFDYQPMITGSFSLVKARNSDYMTGSWFSYGTYATYTGDGYIQSSPRFSFPSFDALMSQPGLAEEGFDEGIQKIAASVAEDIGRQFKPVARPGQAKEEAPTSGRNTGTEPVSRKKRG
ncbi:MAG: hypothetical protein H6R14_1170 [Proteobacteria bacterium]|nr:hypothetical protein [Pseudomonadota bacterium]